MLRTTVSDILERYQVFLLDAYGVLVTTQGALPGAARLIDELNKRDLHYCIITNDASRQPETASRFYRSHGLDIPPSRVVTAGQVIARALNESHPSGSLRCFVLGTSETRQLVASSGHRVIEISLDETPDAVIIGDDSGFDLLPTLNTVISVIHRAICDGRELKLFLANPDVLYPRGERAFGFTAGAIARLIELGIRQLHPESVWTFEVLGKPSRHIFDLAFERLATTAKHAVLLGDQLHTDIRGAKGAGVTAVLVESGITRLSPQTPPPLELRPDFILSSLEAW